MKKIRIIVGERSRSQIVSLSQGHNLEEVILLPKRLVHPSYSTDFSDIEIIQDFEYDPRRHIQKLQRNYATICLPHWVCVIAKIYFSFRHLQLSRSNAEILICPLQQWNFLRPNTKVTYITGKGAKLSEILSQEKNIFVFVMILLKFTMKLTEIMI